MLPDLIETGRLQLRPFRLRDVDEVLEYATDPEWTRYLPVPQPYTQVDAEKLIAGQVLQNRDPLAFDHRCQAERLEMSFVLIASCNYTA